MAARPSPWSRLKSPEQRRLLEALRASIEGLAPGAARGSVVAEKQWGILAVAGGGTRRLPGRKLDRRAHEIRAATDGQWLQLTYRVDGRLVDSATLAAPRADRLGEATSFFARHLPRVWWKAGKPEAEPGGAPAGDEGPDGEGPGWGRPSGGWPASEALSERPRVEATGGR